MGHRVPWGGTAPCLVAVEDHGDREEGVAGDALSKLDLKQCQKVKLSYSYNELSNLYHTHNSYECQEKKKKTNKNPNTSWSAPA